MKLLDTRATSEKTGVPEATLRWWRHVGEGPRSFTLGKRMVRYAEEDVERWLEEQYAKAGAR